VALHRDARVAPVCAHLRHQEDLVTPPRERLAHPRFALPVVVLPRVVEEIQPVIDGLVADADRGALLGDRPEVMAADREDRHVDARLPERPAWHRTRHEELARRRLRWLGFGLGGSGATGGGEHGACARKASQEVATIDARHGPPHVDRPINLGNGVRKEKQSRSEERKTGCS